MESQPQNPEFRNNPGNFHPCISSFLKQNPFISVLYISVNVISIRVPTLFLISNSRTFPGLFQVKQVIFKVSSMQNSRSFPG